MKRLAYATVATIAFAGAAIAAPTFSFQTIDDNRDGALSPEEVTSAYALVSEIVFNTYDGDGNNQLDRDEYRELEQDIETNNLEQAEQ
ncbi:MAG: hypothetical protein AAGE18_01835 [Pseudomonadota bacterium]